MTRQPIPSVTNADVERIVQRDFEAARVAEVLAMLNEYGAKSWHREPARVRLAALKLAGGCVERLRSPIETAKRDYRDVLGLAEHPKYSKRVSVSTRLSSDEVQRIIDNDWKQYQDWLTQ